MNNLSADFRVFDYICDRHVLHSSCQTSRLDLNYPKLLVLITSFNATVLYSAGA